MIHDPIVDEIHAIRDKISKQYHDDIHLMCQAFRAVERMADHKVVILPHKPFVSNDLDGLSNALTRPLND